MDGDAQYTLQKTSIVCRQPPVRQSALENFFHAPRSQCLTQGIAQDRIMKEFT